MHFYTACKIFDWYCIHSMIRGGRESIPHHSKKCFVEPELKNPVPLLLRGTARERTAPEKTDTKKTGSTSAFPAPSVSRHSPQPCPPAGASASRPPQRHKAPSSGAHHHHRCPNAARSHVPFHINCCVHCLVPVCTPRAQLSGAGE